LLGLARVIVFLYGFAQALSARQKPIQSSETRLPGAQWLVTWQRRWVHLSGV